MTYGYYPGNFRIVNTDNPSDVVYLLMRFYVPYSMNTSSWIEESVTSSATSLNVPVNMDYNGILTDIDLETAEISDVYITGFFVDNNSDDIWETYVPQGITININDNSYELLIYREFFTVYNSTNKEYLVDLNDDNVSDFSVDSRYFPPKYCP